MMHAKYQLPLVLASVLMAMLHSPLQAQFLLTATTSIVMMFGLHLPLLTTTLFLLCWKLFLLILIQPCVCLLAHAMNYVAWIFYLLIPPPLRRILIIYCCLMVGSCHSLEPIAFKLIYQGTPNLIITCALNLYQLLPRSLVILIHPLWTILAVLLMLA